MRLLTARFRGAGCNPALSSSVLGVRHGLARPAAIAGKGDGDFCKKAVADPARPEALKHARGKVNENISWEEGETGLPDRG